MDNLLIEAFEMISICAFNPQQPAIWRRPSQAIRVLLDGWTRYLATIPSSIAYGQQEIFSDISLISPLWRSRFPCCSGCGDCGDHDHVDRSFEISSKACNSRLRVYFIIDKAHCFSSAAACARNGGQTRQQASTLSISEVGKSWTRTSCRGCGMEAPYLSAKLVGNRQ